ncbi:MAG TPA: flagellar motor switch protein FliM [Candidatus Rifleibacterium sp.]|nr:flagellar motor switch protein FliM [Candidatus Rifleibacterium sp.]HPT47501.1 flagellar motor switch protein FliM [Candidatus Rifleibacterium sp.]
MVDTLSQNEIDALLSALSPVAEDTAPAAAGSTSFSEPAAESRPKRESAAVSSGMGGSSSSSVERKDGKVERKYDFKRQTKFSKEQLNTISLIHEAFVRLVGTDLSTRLRAFAQATIVSVEQRTFEEFIQSIYNPTFITVFRSDNLDGKALIDINLNVVFTILDRLLGGNGTPLGILRQLTEVERQIMQKVMAGIIDRLREAWINIIDLAPVIELVESNPQFAQIVPPSEVVVSISIEIKIHDVTGMMNLCIPYNTVESIVHKFNAASWFAAVRKEPAQTNVDSISHQVRSVHLPLVAELGATIVTLQDILGLQPGDILVTDQLLKNDLNIRVGNLVKFLGRPGILGKKMAISITQVLEPVGQEEELM